MSRFSQLRGDNKPIRKRSKKPLRRSQERGINMPEWYHRRGNIQFQLFWQPDGIDEFLREEGDSRPSISRCNEIMHKSLGRYRIDAIPTTDSIHLLLFIKELRLEGLLQTGGICLRRRRGVQEMTRHRSLFHPYFTTTTTWQ